MILPNHETRKYTGIVLERIRHLPPGGKMGDLPSYLQHESFVRTGDKKTGGPNMRLIRLEHNEPSLTVTAYIFNKFVHPTEDRYITPREAAVLQDFPLDYAFVGTLGQVQKQIGNAVPVGLAQAVAEEVKKYLQKNGFLGIARIASYFSGAGGLDLGFEKASDDCINFETCFSTDIEEWAEFTINKNRKYWNFHRADITQLAPETVLDFIKKGQMLLLVVLPVSLLALRASSVQPKILWVFYTVTTFVIFNFCSRKLLSWKMFMV